MCYPRLDFWKVKNCLSSLPPATEGATTFFTWPKMHFCLLLSVLATDSKIVSKPYRFRAKNGEFVQLKSTMFCFRNPWTKDVEYIVSNNTVLS